MTMRETAWFAGFVDGEGCFTLDTKMIPRLTITLRVDDAALLERVRHEFGGTVHFKTPRQQEARVNAKPTATWTATAKRDLAGLVRYFDTHPLQSKKARDYAIWRQAVVAYCAHGQRAPGLPELKAALVAVRAFDGDAEPLPKPTQLRLVGGSR